MCSMISDPYDYPVSVILSEGSACTTESKFCRTQRSGVEQNRERDGWKRAAGSPMGFLNVGRAFVAIWQRTRTDHVQLLVCAGRRVINRSQIPLRACRACGFASLHAITLRKTSTSYEIPNKGIRKTLRHKRDFILRSG